MRLLSKILGHRKKSSKRTRNRPKTTPPGGKVKIVTTEVPKSEPRVEDVPPLSSERLKSAGLAVKERNKTGRYFNSSYGLTKRDDSSFNGTTRNGKAKSCHDFRNEITVSSESDILCRERTNTTHENKECGPTGSVNNDIRGINKRNDRPGDGGSIEVVPKLSPTSAQSTKKAAEILITEEGWSVTELPDDTLVRNGKWTKTL